MAKLQPLSNTKELPRIKLTKLELYRVKHQLPVSIQQKFDQYNYHSFFSDTITFDNSYSFLRSKKLHYEIIVTPPPEKLELVTDVAATDEITANPTPSF